jgi:hypothetical protein
MWVLSFGGVLSRIGFSKVPICMMLAMTFRWLIMTPFCEAVGQYMLHFPHDLLHLVEFTYRQARSSTRITKIRSLSSTLPLLPLQFLKLWQLLTSFNQLSHSLEWDLFVSRKLLWHLQYVNPIVWDTCSFCCLQRNLEKWYALFSKRQLFITYGFGFGLTNREECL